ncbi:MAG: hypothetical protein IPM49_18285 [Flavobacteriales bacterium]|nr:hypothetical protein [Flavobacteriales bacterium]MBK9276468.1 hypothetical protein [Flavobacteriales bacterium]HMQ75713.1 type II toxin-antitoxin system RelE/ParE family toxin [Flavobacteriales bacterium]HMR26830.1 type II toxin-antitoxin system RelE/ParE family toxin [Flavobacteriales bacterium]
MSFEVIALRPFQRDLKRLLKKYPSLKKDVATLGAILERDPFIGKSLGKDCYKVRLSITSKGRGKSGGGRVITHVHVAGDTVHLLALYDKAERDTLSDKELEQLLSWIPE